MSARTVTQVARILHAAFRDLVRLQVLHTNPADGVQLPRLPKPRLRVPTAADVASLLEAVEGYYWAPLALAAGTGLRRGEALALRWEAVELEGTRPVLRVEGTLQRASRRLEVLPPKTERSERSVPLSASLVSVLRGQRKEQNERRLLAGEAWQDEGYVFDRGDGRPIDPDKLGATFRRAREAAGLEGVRLHDLRHGFALLVNAQINPRVVSDLLGHATVAFTLGTYFHPNADAAAEAVAKTEELLGDAGRGLGQ